MFWLLALSTGNFLSLAVISPTFWSEKSAGNLEVWLCRWVLLYMEERGKAYFRKGVHIALRAPTPDFLNVYFVTLKPLSTC